MSSIATAWSSRMLSVLRIMTGLLFLEHGTAKLLGFPESEGQPPVDLSTLGGWSGILELGGGALIVLGLFTRPVAFILSGMMAVAYFVVHAPNDFYPINNGGDAAILYCFVFLYMVFAGGGAWSLDRMRGRGA
jgi:putative oxidoreductase